MPGLYIAGAGLVVAAAVSVVLFRRHDEAARQAQAARYDWTPDPLVEEELDARLAGLALMQVGHSRCMEYVCRAAGELYFFPYHCETGVERRRQLHRWVVVAAELGSARSYALVTSQPWLVVTAQLPGRRKLVLDSSGATPLVAIVEDEAEWKALLTESVVEWLVRQPATRSWECIGGCLVGYEPGPVEDTSFVELPRAVRELREMITSSGVASKARAVVG